MHQKLGTVAVLPRTSLPLSKFRPTRSPSHLSPCPTWKIPARRWAGREGQRGCGSARAAPDSPPPRPSRRGDAARTSCHTSGGDERSRSYVIHKQIVLTLLSRDEKQTSRRWTGKINLMNRELDVLPSHTYHMAVISLLHVSSVWDSPSFSPKSSLMSLFRLSSWCPILLFSDWSRHLIPADAGSKTARRQLLSGLSPVTCPGPTPATCTRSVLTAQGSSNTFQPQWQKDGSSFIFITSSTCTLSLARG